MYISIAVRGLLTSALSGRIQLNRVSCVLIVSQSPTTWRWLEIDGSTHISFCTASTSGVSTGIRLSANARTNSWNNPPFLQQPSMLILFPKGLLKDIDLLSPRG